MIPALSPADPSARLAAFWQWVARVQRRQAGWRGVVRGLSLAAGPAVVAILLVPSGWPWALAALAACGLGGGALAACLPRGAPRPDWLAGLAGAPRGFVDGMVAWTEPERWRTRPLAAWFEADLAAGLQQVDAPALAGLGRRPLWNRRWLRRAGWLTLLALLLGLWLAPPWPGLFGPTPPPPEPQPAAAPEAAPQPTGGIAPTPVATGTVELQEPPLDLPSAPQFVVPSFVDDGPSRREQAPVVEVPEAAPASSSAASGSGGQPNAPSPQERFTRAAEAAQRARHVGADERTIVRRYFERLREAGR